MFGAPGTGKSFIAIDMAASVATGTAFNGHPIKAQGGVVYIAGEGHGGVANRFIAKFRDLGNPPGAENIHVSSKALSFTGAGDDVETLVREIDAMPTSPALIVVDTLFRATAGADVNDSKEMSKFWQTVDLIKDRYKCAVLIVHHSGRNDATRSFGSIVHLANADFEISVKSDESGKMMECTKQKDAEEFGPMQFRLNAVEIGRDADFEKITSCVVEFVKRSEASGAKDAETRRIGTEYETPARAASRRIGAMLVKIHDIISKSKDISLTDTLLDVKIPKGLIDELCRKYGVGSTAKRDGIKGLSDPTGKVKPWVQIDEHDRFTITARLARYAREAEYDEGFLDCLELTPDQMTRCIDLP